LQINDDNGTSCRKKQSEKSVVSFHKRLDAHLRQRKKRTVWTCSVKLSSELSD